MTITAGNLVLDSTPDPFYDGNQQPSLDVRFAESKTLNDYITGQNLITFSRPVGANQSPGTYVDENGVIQLSSANAPRFDHNPTTGESLGLLIEESRTNKLINSSDFSSGYGVNATAALDLNSSTAPDGTQTAALLRPTVDTTNASIFRDAGGASGDFVVSVFAKSSGKSWFALYVPQGNAIAWFNVTTGNVGTVQNQGSPYFTSASIEPFGNGWYRCSVKATVTYNYFAALVVDADNSTNVTVNGNDGIYIWGAQLEAGSFPTSYIPTTGTALTRSADEASISGTNFSSWYNQSEGTIFHDGRYIGDVPGNLYGLGNGLIFYFRNTALDLFLYQWSLGIYRGAGISNPPNHSSALYNGTTGVFLNVADQLANNPVGSRMKSVGFINTSTGEFGHVLNGGTIRSNSANNIPIWNKVSLSAGYNNQARCGTIARFTYYPYRLADARLQSLTA